MEHYSYSISQTFSLASRLRSRVVIATGRERTVPAELVHMLRDSEESVRARVNLEQIAEEPHQSWREAYRAFGASRRISARPWRPWPGGSAWR